MGRDEIICIKGVKNLMGIELSRNAL